MAEQNQNAPRDKPLPIEPEPIELEPEPAEPKPVPIEIEPIPVPPDEVSEEEPISLVEISELEGPSKVHALRGTAMAVEKHEFKRPLNLSGQGATRCRLFHSRIAQAPLELMQKSINSWLDEGEIEVKHVSQVIGTMEGKNPEPNLIVMVWY